MLRAHPISKMKAIVHGLSQFWESLRGVVICYLYAPFESPTPSPKKKMLYGVL